jgi:hypothetical protein
MTKQISIVFLAIYMTAWVVYALCMVGENSECKPYDASLPVLVFAFAFIPALLGYHIGKED